MRRGRSFRQDAQPPERKNSLVSCKCVLNAWTADSVKAVASGNEVTGQFTRLAVSLKAHDRFCGVEVLDDDIFNFKKNLAARRQARVDQILNDFRLSVDGDATSAGEFLEVDTVAASAEAQFDSMVDEAFSLHAFANTGFGQQVDRILFEHAGANPLLDIFAAAALQDHRFDSFKMQQMR